MTPRTKVIFRKERDGEVVAYFPEDPGSRDPYTCTCFAHIGQHGIAAADVTGTKPASPTEYAALKRELESAPYNYDLVVVHKFTQKHLQTRVKELNR